MLSFGEQTGNLSHRTEVINAVRKICRHFISGGIKEVKSDWKGREIAPGNRLSYEKGFAG